MGLDIAATEFTDDDRHLFAQRLQQNLAALKQLLRQPGFGSGAATIGAELELFIIDRHARPSPRNQLIHAAVADPRLTLELDRFNLEYNLSPVAAAGHPFSSIEREMLQALQGINRCANEMDARVIPIGILPTLAAADFGPHSMTPLPRYAALAAALQRMRGEDFAIRIHGAEPLSLDRSHVSLEGANTSLQIHYRVEPRDFARMFNAVQLVTPVALAIACNSPLLLGRRLWQETRIPLFKLAVDGRNRDSRTLHLPPRVDFGTGWVREGPYELFAAATQLHEPLLPVVSRENALSRLRSGNVPGLHELRLHQGTLWPWNRPVYDPACGGHLRIELRALPAGPSPVDMMANAAFVLGSARALSENIEELLPGFPFRSAEANFYRAAEHGLEARLFWHERSGALRLRPACDIALELMPAAARGLRAMGVARGEIRHYLGNVQRRIECRASGAAWQLRQLDRLQPQRGRRRALAALVQRYADHALNNLPVAEWPDIE
jgi:gamma-glutamyl:cysteine ligase YbdK (ATP-grasp superfamily)